MPGNATWASLRMSSSYCKNLLPPGRSDKCAIVPITEPHVIKLFATPLLFDQINSSLTHYATCSNQQLLFKTAIEPVKELSRAKNINSPQVLRKRMTSENRLEIFIQRTISLHKVSQSFMCSCSSFRSDLHVH